MPAQEFSLAARESYSNGGAGARGSTLRVAADRGLEPRLADLPAKDRQLVAEHEDLELLLTITAAEQNDQLEQPADEDVQR
jgi:hypothetical protein